MKKLLLGAVSIVSAVCVSAVSVFAAASSIKITDDSTPQQTVSYSYDDEKTTASSKSIDKLLYSLDDLKEGKSVSQKITVASESASNKPVSISLKLEIPVKATPTPKATATPKTTATPKVSPTPTPDTYSGLDYYNIKIYDTHGEVVYSYLNDAEIGGTEKEIPLGVFNKQAGREVKTYTIEFSVNQDIKDKDVINEAKKVEWYITSMPGAAPTATPKITATPKPTASASASVHPIATATAVPTAEPTATAEPTEVPAVTQKPDGGLPNGTYEVGKKKDIEPGKYTIKGSGNVKVYGTDGKLKTNVELTEDPDDEGVEKYDVNLLSGEKVNVTGDISFTPYTVVKATAKVTTKPTTKTTKKPTTKPTSKPTAKATKKPTATPKATAVPKSNPKTGDTTPIVALSAVAVVALGAVVFIQVKKKKEDK